MPADVDYIARDKDELTGDEGLAELSWRSEARYLTGPRVDDNGRSCGGE